MVEGEAQLEAELAVIRAQAEALLQDAEQVDRPRTSASAPIAAAMSCPTSSPAASRRLERIRAVKQVLEDEAREHEQAGRAELHAQGKHPRRPPGGRDPFAPRPREQRNFTDPESKIIRPPTAPFSSASTAGDRRLKGAGDRGGRALRSSA